MSDPKGYWIAHVIVTDDGGYQAYRDAAPAAIQAYGGQFLARAGRFEQMEGALPGARHVVIEFPSYRAAVECFRSEAYQAARTKRLAAGEANILIVEGA